MNGFNIDSKTEIENLINSFYSVISGHPDQKRNWELFRTLFSPGARLLPLKHNADGTSTENYDVEQYIKRLESFLSGNEFYEYGENYRINIFKNMAHAYTEYKAGRRPGDEAIIKKGVNLIQFINSGQKWKISSMQWEDY